MHLPLSKDFYPNVVVICVMYCSLLSIIHWSLYFLWVHVLTVCSLQILAEDVFCVLTKSEISAKIITMQHELLKENWSRELRC